MRDRPHGVTGTRNEDLLAALEVVMQERDVRPDEAEAFREGFIEGWRARGIAEPGTVNVTREYLAYLERRTGRP